MGLSLNTSRSASSVARQREAVQRLSVGSSLSTAELIRDMAYCGRDRRLAATDRELYESAREIFESPDTLPCPPVPCGRTRQPLFSMGSGWNE